MSCGRGEAAALVAAYVQAQHTELVLRWLLARADVPAVSPYRWRGSTCVVGPRCGLLYTSEQAHLSRIIAAIRSVIESRPIDAA